MSAAFVCRTRIQTNTFASIQHLLSALWVFLPLSLSPVLACLLHSFLASQFLFAFRFMIFALPPFCVTISLPVLQYIYIYVSHRIYRTYIQYIQDSCCGKKFRLESGKKFCVSAQSHPIKRLAAKGACVPRSAACPTPSILSPSLSFFPSLSPLNIPSTVASLGCGLMSLPRRRQTHPHTATVPHCHILPRRVHRGMQHIYRELSCLLSSTCLALARSICPALCSALFWCQFLLKCKIAWRFHNVVKASSQSLLHMDNNTVIVVVTLVVVCVHIN